MDKIMEFLPFLLPIVLIELVLIIVALVDLFRHKNCRFGNRIIWVIVIVALQLLGPILYFTIGRGDTLRKDADE